jgi:hypothetical protein
MNLWSELDNQQTSVETVKSRRTRRLTEDFVLSALRAWLLGDYVLPYCRTLAASRIYRRCYWIDGWGGDTRTFVAGKANGAQPTKRRKKEVAPALPAILQPVVSLSALLAQEQRPIALNGLMLVAGSSSRRRKVGENDALVLPKESGLVRGNWQDVAPVLLKEIASSPALFLLNPFGPALFTQDDLAPLYQRTTAPTELCLLIPHKQAEARLLAVARTTEGATQLTTLLRSDRWKMVLSQDGAKEGKDTAPLLDRCIEMLVAELQRHFLTVQQIAFPVLTRSAIVETAPYTLLFATRSKESLLCMNDAVCLYGRRVVAESFTGTLNETWFAAQQQERFAEEQQRLYARMVQQGQAQRPRRWPELRQQLLLTQFGHYAVCEYDATLSQLVADGVVRCAWKRPQSTEEEQRVPGNDDMLLWR